MILSVVILMFLAVVAGKINQALILLDEIQKTIGETQKIIRELLKELNK